MVNMNNMINKLLLLTIKLLLDIDSNLKMKMNDKHICNLSDMIASKTQQNKNCNQMDVKSSVNLQTPYFIHPYISNNYNMHKQFNNKINNNNCLLSPNNKIGTDNFKNNYMDIFVPSVTHRDSTSNYNNGGRTNKFYNNFKMGKNLNSIERNQNSSRDFQQANQIFGQLNSSFNCDFCKKYGHNKDNCPNNKINAFNYQNIN